jgi:MFS superfamily sulfate permease-like transporter
LARLQVELEAKGITLSFAEAKNALRQSMRRTGLEEKVGVVHFYESIQDSVQAFLQGRDPKKGETAVVSETTDKPEKTLVRS